MKKSLLIALSILLVGAFVLSGCGDSKQAKEILDKCNEAMMGVHSVVVSVTMKSSEGESTTDMELSKIDFADKSGAEMEGHITSTTAGQTSEAYLIGEWVFFQVAGGWAKVRKDQVPSIAESTGAMDINEFSKSAENVKLISEDGDSYEISFDLGERFFKQALEEQKKTGDLSAEELKAVEEQARNGSIRAVYKIAKTTFYLEDATMKVDLSGAKEDVRMQMSRFNEPIAVTLPPEAENAPEQQVPLQQ